MQQFFRPIWPSEDTLGNVTVWCAPSKKSAHIPLKDFLALTPEDIAELHADNRAGQNIYFGLGLRADGLTPHRQGGKKDIIAMPGLGLDIDFAHSSAHVAQNLPVTEADGMEILALTPEPSLIVKSGHGWHVYWFFHRPILLETMTKRTQLQKAYRAFQAPLIEFAKSRGWHLDNTASIQRVWRVPGFINHKSGATVEVILDNSSTRYDLEDLVDAKISDRTEVTPHPNVSSTKIVHRDEDLKELVESLRKISPDNQNKDAIDAVLRGESFASAGERDEMMQRVCSTIAWTLEARYIPAEKLAELLRPSLLVWANEIGAEKDIDQEVEKAADKILRAQQDQLDKREAQRTQLAGLVGALRANVDSDLGGDDLTDVPNEVILQHLIIQHKAAYYIFNFDQDEYVGPKIQTEVLTYVRQAWVNAPGGVSLDYVNDKDVLKQKTLPRIMYEYSRVADVLLGEFCLAKSEYRLSDNTFIESVAPIRDHLNPVYDVKIAHWLDLLGGKNKGKLLDWIASVPRLTGECGGQCGLLYLEGASGAGKGLLASGLAQLWEAGRCSNLEDVIGPFNADMFRCPLIVLDEGLSDSRKRASTEIRRIIGTSNFPFKEKFMPTRSVNGAVRLLVTANNPHIFSADENMSANDLDAYVKRFIHVPARPEAAEWLRENNTNGMTQSWVVGEKIAEHCLWLLENRVVVPGTRFLVEGEELGDIHRRAVMGGEVAGLIYLWLTRFISSPRALVDHYRMSTKDKNPLARVGGGRVFVNTNAVVDAWGAYMAQEVSVPNVTKIKEVLERCSSGVVRLGTKGNRPRHYDVQFDLILGWAVENQVGDELAMHRNFKSEMLAEVKTENAT